MRRITMIAAMSVVLSACGEDALVGRWRCTKPHIVDAFGKPLDLTGGIEFFANGTVQMYEGAFPGRAGVWERLASDAVKIVVDSGPTANKIIACHYSIRGGTLAFRNCYYDLIGDLRREEE